MADTLRKFLIVDDNADSRFLLAKTLQRKFPSAIILESQTSDGAVALLSSERPDLVLAHRTFENDGTTLIRLLRVIHPDVPIVMVSGIDRRQTAAAAGATAFLHYDEWLRIGTVVAEVLDRPSRPGTPGNG